MPGAAGLHAARTVLDALPFARSTHLCRVVVSGEVVARDALMAATRRTIERCFDPRRLLRSLAIELASAALDRDALRPDARAAVESLALAPATREASAALDRARDHAEERARDADDELHSLSWELERRHASDSLRERSRDAQRAAARCRAHALSLEALATVDRRAPAELDAMFEVAMRARAWLLVSEHDVVDGDALDRALQDVRRAARELVDQRALAILDAKPPSARPIQRDAPGAGDARPADHPADIEPGADAPPAEVVATPPAQSTSSGTHDAAPAAPGDVRWGEIADRTTLRQAHRLGSFVPALELDGRPRDRAPQLDLAPRPPDPTRHWHRELAERAALLGAITGLATLDLVPASIFGVLEPTYAAVVAIARWSMHEEVAAHLASVRTPEDTPTECLVLGAARPDQAFERGEVHATKGLVELLVEWRRGLVTTAVERAWRDRRISIDLPPVDPRSAAEGLFTPLRVRCTECDRLSLVPLSTSLVGVRCDCGASGSLVAYAATPSPRAGGPRWLECPGCTWRFVQRHPTPHDVCPRCRRLVEAPA